MGSSEKGDRDSLASRLIARVGLVGELVTFAHTLFALPFALAGALLAGRPWPSAAQFLWIAVAMVGARTGAMAFNRLVDVRIDAANPRTRGRPLPSGRIGRSEVALLAVLSFVLLVYAASRLNALCLKLSPVAIAWVCFYSFTKRFSWGAHFVLGASLAMAPVGAWIAVRGSFGLVPFALALSVVLWVAGFDILYALQDMDFDRKRGLMSIPSVFGVRRSLILSRLLHALALLPLFALTGQEGMGWLYAAGIAAGGVLLAVEHSLVSAGNLRRLNAAFFTVNSFFSVVVLLAVVAGKVGP